MGLCNSYPHPRARGVGDEKAGSLKHAIGTATVQPTACTTPDSGGLWVGSKSLEMDDYGLLRTQPAVPSNLRGRRER